MRAPIKTNQLAAIGMILFTFLITSCAQTTYVYQNGTTYNDYEVATNYRIKSATKKSKVQYSKAPNWKKITSRYRYN